MSFFASITDRVAAIRELVGEVPDAALLPAVVECLDDSAAMELLELSAVVGQMAERVRVAAAGVVAQRSTREAGHSGLAQSAGHRNAVSLVQQVTGVSRGEAARQVRVGESLYDTAATGAQFGASGECAGVESVAGADAAISGTAGGLASGSGTAGAMSAVAGPWHAPLGRALLDGTISAVQHDAIFRGLGQPPAHNCEPAAADPASAAVPAAVPDSGPQWALCPEHDCVQTGRELVAAWSVAAEELVVEAGWRTVEDLGRAARAVRDRLDPVGAEARYLARNEQRSFRMWTDREGQHRVALVCDDESAAWLRSVRDAALRPRRGGPRFVDPAEQACARDLVADPRSNEQLEFDLFIDLLRAGSLAEAETVYGTRQAGVRLVQIIDTDGTPGAARFEDDPAFVPARAARQRACTSGVVPVVLDRAGRPLDVGREQRLYTARQRIALAIRDGGCRWPGCDRPPAYCEAHHIDEWRKDQGRTDLDRGVLLCRFHHMQLHNRGWRITRAAAQQRGGAEAASPYSGASGTGCSADARAGIRNGVEPPDTDDFVLHDPGGGATPMRPRIELRYALRDADLPPRRLTRAA